MVADDKYRVLWVNIEIISTPDTYRLYNVEWLIHLINQCTSDHQILLGLGKS